jgi:antitoxin (DNA-binding transcriptional repressor) of toxin-antitoxin stability system
MKLYTRSMAMFRITEADLARDVHEVLTKVEAGDEVVIEREHSPVAVIRRPEGPGRRISECIARVKAYEKKLGYAPTLDEDWAADLQEFIDAHPEPLDTSAWD